ncbi:hypothetical protein ABK040_012470 [Willaertia magna]
MLTLPDLTNKFVVITGASSGIGEALAYELGKHHCNLILLARSEDKLKEIKATITTEPNVIDAWEFMININLTNLMRITHSLLPLLLPKNKEILKTHPPAIINISSMLGRMVFNNAEGYCASKYGVVGFTKALFEDVREKGIKVTVIEPGFVNTKMPQTKHDNLEREKMMQVEDIVDTILYVLCTKSTICPTEIMVQSQVNPFKPL